MTRVQALEARRSIEGLGVELLRTFSNSATIVVRTPPELAPAIKRLPHVDYVEPLMPFALAGARLLSGPVQDPPPPPPQDTTWGHLKVGADRAWRDGHVGTYGFITILDSGIDSVHMFNLYGDANDMGFVCAYTVPTFDSCWDRLAGHGSLVHSVALSLDNSVGYIGIAHEPKFNGNAMVKVCDTLCHPADVAGGLDWTATNGKQRQIVNMSLGSDPDNAFGRDLVHEQVVRSANAGNLLVAAAGNGGTPAVRGVNWPANFSEVVAVSGTLENDGFADGGNFTPSWCVYVDGTPGTSRFGPEVEISAPFWAWGMDLNRGYQQNCGTSFAAPVVSAAAALIWSANLGWTAAQVRQRLRDTAKDLGPFGWDERFGYGRVDACRAVDCPGLLTASISGPSSVKPGAFCTWFAIVGGGRTPYTYQWSGKLSGSGSQVSGSLSSSGTLYLDVTSGDGQSAGDQLWITVSSTGDPCEQL